VHREFNPAQMAFGHTHGPDHHHHHDHGHGHGHPHAQHEHDHQAELRMLVATTLVVGLLLGADLVLAAWGVADRRVVGVSLTLLAAVIGGGRVVYLAVAALLEGRIGADIALAVACVAAAMGEYAEQA
jgi:hypothetical protein